ncbi:hypothetical protein RirG_215730 [Rhizophagus irregularis DAOM 197198w]|uniref:Crinkler effector protein N-terminal domain-containing protein n=2 Tax=Rhizophagus irregularis TaxID=588596 RepID=A0A015IQH6_RHIIW|nr:hypothetical protein RirG_215730 [Rhizophagus irregularis DAOM 197198w]
MVSINCLLLGKTSFLDTFVVDVAKESNIHGSLVKFDNLKILDLKYLVYNEINHDIKFNYKDIDLWKVDIAYGERDKLKHVTTKDDIIEKFGGERLIHILD